jgi:hypothetical protein
MLRPGLLTGRVGMSVIVVVIVLGEFRGRNDRFGVGRRRHIIFLGPGKFLLRRKATASLPALLSVHATTSVRLTWKWPARF